MFATYLQAAMRHAVYEQLDDDKTYYGSIPGFQGVWANAPTLEGCREELLEVVEDWVLFRIANHQALPTVDGYTLTVKASV